MRISLARRTIPASQFEPLYCLATSRRVSSHYAYSEEELFDKYREQLKVKKIMPPDLCRVAR